MTLVAFMSVVTYFFRNAIWFSACTVCLAKFLDAGSVEETYVKELLKRKAVVEVR
jgi:mannitol/fructose-specific phosphotransferase system IIA component